MLFLILLLLYYLGQKSGKKGRKKEYFPLSLPALSLLESFLFSEQNEQVNRQIKTVQWIGTYRPLCWHKYCCTGPHHCHCLPVPTQWGTQAGKAQTGGSSSIQFLPFLPQWKAYWAFTGNGKGEFWDELCILLCLPTWHLTVSYCLYSLNLI